MPRSELLLFNALLAANLFLGASAQTCSSGPAQPDWPQIYQSDSCDNCGGTHIGQFDGNAWKSAYGEYSNSFALSTYEIGGGKQIRFYQATSSSVVESANTIDFEHVMLALSADGNTLAATSKATDPRIIRVWKKEDNTDFHSSSSYIDIQKPEDATTEWGGETAHYNMLSFSADGTVLAVGETNANAGAVYIYEYQEGYTKVTSGTCQTPITTTSECNAARLSLGLTDSVNTGAWNTPPGCNYNANTNNVFLDVGTAPANCDSITNCICKEGNWVQTAKIVDDHWLDESNKGNTDFAETVKLSRDGTVVAIGNPYSSSSVQPSGYVVTYKFDPPAKINSGTCDTPITTTKECEAAAAALNLYDKNADGANEVTQNTRATGCIYSPLYEALMFNTDSNSINCGSSQFECVCAGGWKQMGDVLRGSDFFQGAGYGENLALNKDGTVLAVATKQRKDYTVSGHDTYEDTVHVYKWSAGIAVKTFGTCNAYITTAAECNTAAQQLGLPDMTSDSSTWTNRPPGCFQNTITNKLFFNRHTTASPVECSETITSYCVCKEAGWVKTPFDLSHLSKNRADGGTIPSHQTLLTIGLSLTDDGNLLAVGERRYSWYGAFRDSSNALIPCDSFDENGDCIDGPADAHHGAALIYSLPTIYREGSTTKNSIVAEFYGERSTYIAMQAVIISGNGEFLFMKNHRSRASLFKITACCVEGTNNEVCQNGGTPTGSIGSCGCSCANGFEGPNCDVVVCDEGSYNDGSNNCVPNQCTCKLGTQVVGTGASGAFCSADGNNECESCLFGYYLDGNTCVENQCTCPDSASYVIKDFGTCDVPITTATECRDAAIKLGMQDIPDELADIGNPHFSSKCLKNANNYVYWNLYRSTIECGVHGFNCICKASAGVAATGPSCPADGSVKCVSCNTHYSLNAVDHTCEAVSCANLQSCSARLKGIPVQEFAVELVKDAQSESACEEHDYIRCSSDSVMIGSEKSPDCSPGAAACEGVRLVYDDSKWYVVDYDADGSFTVLISAELGSKATETAAGLAFKDGSEFADEDFADLVALDAELETQADPAPVNCDRFHQAKEQFQNLLMCEKEGDANEGEEGGCAGTCREGFTEDGSGGCTVETVQVSNADDTANIRKDGVDQLTGRDKMRRMRRNIRRWFKAMIRPTMQSLDVSNPAKTKRQARKEKRMKASLADSSDSLRPAVKNKLKASFGEDRDVGIVVGPENDKDNEACAAWVAGADLSDFDDGDECITYDAAVEEGNDAETDVHLLGSEVSYSVGGVRTGGAGGNWVPLVKQTQFDDESFDMSCWGGMHWQQKSPPSTVYVDFESTEAPFYKFYADEECASKEIVPQEDGKYYLKAQTYTFKRCASDADRGNHAFDANGDGSGIENDQQEHLTVVKGDAHLWECTEHPLTSSTPMYGFFVGVEGWSAGEELTCATGVHASTGVSYEITTVVGSSTSTNQGVACGPGWGADGDGGCEECAIPEANGKTDETPCVNQKCDGGHGAYTADVGTLSPVTDLKAARGGVDFNPALDGRIYNDNCVICPDGYYSIIDSGYCYPLLTCETGEYTTTPGSKGSAGVDGVQTACSACDEGKYHTGASSPTDTSACSFCGEGTEFVNKQSECTACEEGKYQDSDSTPSATCSDLYTCPSGRYTSNAGTSASETVCDDCVTGKYHTGASSPTDTSACSFCSAGTEFVNKESECTACAAGKYQESGSTASAECKHCSAGTEFVDKQSECTACETGKYQESDSTPSASCKFCGEGTEFVNKQSACTACEEGKYQDSDSTASATCSDLYTCPSGWYTSNAGTSASETVCKECVTGKYHLDASSATDTSACSFCSPGTEFVDKQSECTDCETGKYQESGSTASAECKVCSKGERFIGKQYECADCPTGKYQISLTAGDQGVCKFCGEGFEFVDKQSECSACAAGKYQDSNIEPSATCQDQETCGAGFATSAEGTLSSKTQCTACDDDHWIAAATGYDAVTTCSPHTECVNADGKATGTAGTPSADTVCCDSEDKDDHCDVEDTCFILQCTPKELTDAYATLESKGACADSRRAQDHTEEFERCYTSGCEAAVLLNAFGTCTESEATE